MRCEWEKYFVGDICSSISDTYRGSADKVVLVNTSDVLEGKVLNHQLVQNEHLKGQFKKTFCLGDILYSEIRPQNKRFAFVDFDSDEYIASTKLMVIRVNSRKILPRFLYYFLTSKQVISEMQTLAETRSGTFPQITFSELSNVDILLPPTDIQQEIVNIIKCLDDKIELNQRINENLERQGGMLYQQAFPYTASDDLPDGWSIGTVGDIVELHDSKRVPLSGTVRDKMKSKKYPYYGAASLMDYVDNYIFDGKYLLLGEDGTVVDRAGYPILQYVWGRFWVNNHAHVLTGKLGYNIESLYLLLKQTPVKSIVTGAVQPKISQVNLRSIQIVIPPEEELQSFNNRIEPIFSQIRLKKEENDTLAAIRDTLLPKLMSGEIDVSNTRL